MNGSIAIWYEPHQAEGQRPRVELHFNLWRDLPSRINFLDIGLLISKPKDIGRIYIYIPAQLDIEQISDLSHVLKYGHTLNAVFGDVVEVTSQADCSYDTVSKGATHARIHHMEIGKDIRCEPVAGVDAAGCQIVICEAACRRIRESPLKRQYVRFRVSLTGAAKALFSEQIVAKDQVSVSVADNLEITEFRLNEQRSYPTSLALSARKSQFHITSIQYFLIRDVRHVLQMQHTQFKKVRRLEPRIWAAYLSGRSAGFDAKFNEQLASRMVIYHWRGEKDNGDPIDDFVAFASFKESASTILYFAVGVLLLGAAGNLLSDLVQIDLISEGWSNLFEIFAFLAATGLLFLIPMAISAAKKAWASVTDAVAAWRMRR